MSDFTPMKKVKVVAKPAAPASGSKTGISPRPSAGTSPSGSDRLKISLQDVRRGIVLSEILGEPLSRRRGYPRWR